MEMQAPKRVAARLDDMACVEMEHGHEEVADMLRDEAMSLRNGSIMSVVNYSSSRQHDSEVTCVSTLRDLARSKAKHRKVVERADDLILEAWLAEGYASHP